MASKSPEGLRWCKQCDRYMEIAKFGNYKRSLCHDHWLVWNREKRRKAHQANPDSGRARSKRWHEKNPDKTRDSNSKSTAKQKELGWPSMKKWIANNPDAARASWRKCDNAWRRANPEKAAAQSHRKRAKRRGAPGHHSGEELYHIGEHFGWKCAYCDKMATTWDHVIALHRGGTDFAWNMIPSCLICNIQKGTKAPDLSIGICRPDVEAYIRDAIDKHEALGNPNAYVRDRYQKVSDQSLWDEVRRVFLRDGKLTVSGLNNSKHASSTYNRRLGSMEKLVSTMKENHQ